MRERGCRAEAHSAKAGFPVNLRATARQANCPYWEVIRLSVCKTGVFKQAGSDDWSITSTSHHFGLVAQLEERPVVCGRVEGANPFGSANFKSYREADSQGFGVAFPPPISKIHRGEPARSVEANALGLGPRDRRCKSCRADQFTIAAVVEYMRHPPSKRNDAGGNPAGSAIAR